jgi:hypothetical protein
MEIHNECQEENLPPGSAFHAESGRQEIVIERSREEETIESMERFDVLLQKTQRNPSQ